jgi:hypothetical protein
MLMKTGRDREVSAIVTHDRAVEVANMLLGKLNRPLRYIFPEDYRSLPRFRASQVRRLRQALEGLRAIA